MHLVLGAMTILLELSIIGFGATAFGRRFRLYSILTIAAVVVFWGLSLLYAPRLAAGEPTPWLGVIERIALGAWLLWLAVLAIVLMRGGRTRTLRTPKSGATVDMTVDRGASEVADMTKLDEGAGGTVASDGSASRATHSR